MYVDATTAARLQADLETMQAAADANQKARPCGMFDHKAGKASFLPKRFWWLDGRGVMLDVEWTKAGREAVEGRDYSYFSPTFKLRNGVVTGLDERVEIGSLVNSPAFESMERIAAARTDDDLPEDGSEVVLCGEVDTLETLEARKADIERRIDELKDGDHAPKSAPKNAQGVDDEAADDAKTDAKTDAKHDDGGDISPLKKAHFAVLKRMDGEQRVKEGKKGGALDGVMARVRHAAACAGCEPAIKGARELVQAANPYGCNQYGHGFKEPHNGESSHSDKNGGSSGGADDGKRDYAVGAAKKKLISATREHQKALDEYNAAMNSGESDKEKIAELEKTLVDTYSKYNRARVALVNAYKKYSKTFDADMDEYEKLSKLNYHSEGVPKRGDERNVKENTGKKQGDSGTPRHKNSRQIVQKSIDTARKAYSGALKKFGKAYKTDAAIDAEAALMNIIEEGGGDSRDYEEAASKLREEGILVSPTMPD
ncbi:MAG: hypothetical protein MJ074_06425 [Oscillospiraceae bacterium]|nr:hypothetical protein [Oscillospiraceae bacterium]